jgi:hypothetical protein
VTLLTTVLVVVGNILVLVFEGSPRVEIVEEIVESLNFLERAILVAEFGYRLDAGEPTFGFEDIAP